MVKRLHALLEIFPNPRVQAACSLTQRVSHSPVHTLSPPRKHFLWGAVGCARAGRVASFPCEEIATPQAAERVQRLFISLSLRCLREAKDKKGKETRKGKGPGTGSKSKGSPLYSSLIQSLDSSHSCPSLSPPNLPPTPREVVCKFISELGSERNICVVPLESSYLPHSTRCDARI